MIDLRSDTVTRPTEGMRLAMNAAAVGDDVFGDDLTMNALQSRLAAMFGVEQALFFPSGTMANQAAIMCHVGQGDELICDQYAHVYKYEGGGIAANAGASVRTVVGNRGIFTAADVLQNINVNDPHFPSTKLVCIENTMNRGGGACWSQQQIEEVSSISRKQGLKIHLDGARLWNAMVKTGLEAHFFGQQFDSISVCFSKGLGCPVGSVLLGNSEFIGKAHRIRKRLGGGMRQVGILAAACNYALDHHIHRLADDHHAAHKVASVLNEKNWVTEVMPVETNILMFRLENEEKAKQFVDALKDKQVFSTATGNSWIRFTFHMDVTAGQLDELMQILQEMP